MAKLCLTLFFKLALSSGLIYAQNLDSRAGDEQALLDLYNSTNGDNWHDRTGWNNGEVSLEDNPIGITVEKINGELRVTAIDLQKVTYENGTTKGNNLTGTLPESLGNLKEVTYFNVKQNNLVGAIPDGFGGMGSLEWLSLAGQGCDVRLDRANNANHRDCLEADGKTNQTTNAFTGPLPASIGNLSNLEIIEIRRQAITGTLPPEWGNLINIKGIYIDHRTAYGGVSASDLLSGGIPEEWAGMTLIQQIYLTNYLGDGNGLNGVIPQAFKDALITEERSFLVFGNNNLTGDLPDFPNLRNIRTYNFSRNNFTGEFPIQLFNQGNNSDLNSFDISFNDVAGIIPDNMVPPTFPRSHPNYDNIALFRVGYSGLTGPLPQWVQSLRRNVQLQFSNSGFTGPFPKTAAEGRNVRLFFMDGNEFTGELPDVDWRSGEVTSITISNNNFEGSIPESWGSIIYNHLDGNGEFTGRLSRFEAENMELSGPIPSWVLDVPEWGPDGTAGLRRFRVKNNRFTFKDLIPTHDYLKTNLGEGYIVTPQKPFGSRTERTMPAGETVVLDLSGFEYDGNLYQWYKNGQAINGATSSVLRIENVSDSDEGEYILNVSNSALPELGVHSSEPVIFTIGENDGLNGDSSTEDSDPKDNGDSPGGNAFPASPDLRSPTHLQDNVSLQPRLKWSSVEGADYYILHMSRNSPNGMVLDVTVDDTTYTPNDILGQESRHQWRVRAVKNDEMGEWSEVYWFDTEVSNIPLMADLVGPDHYSESVDLLPNLEWENVDADKFRLRVFEKGVAEAVILDESLTNTYKPDNPLNAQTNYIWQIKSLKNGVEGAWGPRWEFSTGDYIYSVDQPELLSPNTGSEYETLTPTFEWQAMDADHYVITLSDAPPRNVKTLVSGATENEPQVLYEETTETIYSFNQPLDPEKQYYWRVKAVKGDDEGEWSDTWEFRTPATYTDIESSDGESPVHTELMQNYPNPFNPTTQIEFTLAEAKRVSLTVYNTAGQLVATLVDGAAMRAGRHTATFNAGNLASGVYIYRLIYGNEVLKPQKMTLVK